MGCFVPPSKEGGAGGGTKQPISVLEQISAGRTKASYFLVFTYPRCGNRGASVICHGACGMVYTPLSKSNTTICENVSRPSECDDVISPARVSMRGRQQAAAPREHCSGRVEPPYQCSRADYRLLRGIISDTGRGAHHTQFSQTWLPVPRRRIRSRCSLRMR